ncbi:hypothetical protein BD779DRAFT_1472059 [Infundibulicybe gibba]|nr:hypothetical protein BD779DRAFT_1472059 [Infundibulicybe gibba]
MFISFCFRVQLDYSRGAIPQYQTILRQVGDLYFHMVLATNSSKAYPFQEKPEMAGSTKGSFRRTTELQARVAQARWRSWAGGGLLSARPLPERISTSFNLAFSSLVTVPHFLQINPMSKAAQRLRCNFPSYCGNAVPGAFPLLSPSNPRQRGPSSSQLGLPVRMLRRCGSRPACKLWSGHGARNMLGANRVPYNKRKGLELLLRTTCVTRSKLHEIGTPDIAFLLGPIRLTRSRMTKATELRIVRLGPIQDSVKRDQPIIFRQEPPDWHPPFKLGGKAL